MGDVLPLPGDRGPAGTSKRRPRTWGIEIVPVGPKTEGNTRSFPQSVRVTLIDRENGKRVGSRQMPWGEFRDAASGMVLFNIDEGVHEGVGA